MNLVVKIALQKVMNIYNIDWQWQLFKSLSNIVNEKVMD